MEWHKGISKVEKPASSNINVIESQNLFHTPLRVAPLFYPFLI